MRELVQMAESDQLGFHTAHRQTGHRPIRLIGQRAEVRIDKRHQFVNQYLFEMTDIEVAQAAGRVSLVMP